jgi:hypothetical protein
MPKKPTTSGGTSKKAQRMPIDTGTKEFGRRHRVVPVKMKTSVLVKVMDSTAIDRALMKDIVDPEQHSVLVAFQKDCYAAALIGPRRVSDYGRPMGTGAAHDISTREAEALQLVGRAIDYVDQSASRRVREALLRMVLSETDEPAADIRSAADSLVKFYCDFRRVPRRTL